MDRQTFSRRSFWMVIVAFSLFAAIYGPTELLDKVFGFGLVGIAVTLVALRSPIIEWMSFEETKTNPKDQNNPIKTGRIIRADDDITERFVIVLCALISLFSLYKLSGELQVNVLSWTGLCTIAAVATRRAHDQSERDVSKTQVNVFYAIPILVAISLFGAYLAGLNVWFVVGTSLLTAIWHLRYGYVLDSVERASDKSVVHLKAVQSA